MPASLLYYKQFDSVPKHAFKVQNDIGSLTGDLLHCFVLKLTFNNLKLRLFFLFILSIQQMVDILEIFDVFQMFDIFYMVDISQMGQNYF